MEIVAEKLTIPKSNYPAKVSMPSASFAKIVRDLSSIGESSKTEDSSAFVNGLCFFYSYDNSHKIWNFVQDRRQYWNS